MICSTLRLPVLVSLLFVELFAIGCDGDSRIRKAGKDFRTAISQGESWHEKFGWEAGVYFGDPKLIELCHAIEVNDLVAMKGLIDGGVDVNALGKRKMTPLLWAFPDNQLERFELLMKAGANPNIYIESDFGVPHAFEVGDSLTHMAARNFMLVRSGDKALDLSRRSSHPPE